MQTVTITEAQFLDLCVYLPCLMICAAFFGHQLGQLVSNLLHYWFRRISRRYRSHVRAKARAAWY